MNNAATIGIIWGIGSALGFAFYQIVNRQLIHQANIYRTTFLSLSISVLVGLIFMPFLEQSTSWQLITAQSVFWFSLSGFFHFSAGWTLLSLSQRIIGAVQTSPLTSSSVVISAISGMVLFAEPFNILLSIGILLMIIGIILISKQQSQSLSAKENRWKGLLFGLLAGTCWAASPIFFRWGYLTTPSAFIAVFIGLVTGAVVSGAIWLSKMRKEENFLSLETTSVLKPSTFWVLQFSAGLIVGIAIFARWISLVYLPIVDVNALNMLAIPAVVIIGPVVLRKGLEQSGLKLWMGTASMLVGVGCILYGGAL